MKEQGAFTVMELAGEPTIAHDDKLLLRGQKHKVGLSVNWKFATDIKRKNGSLVVVSYHRTGTDGEHERVSASDYEGLPSGERGGYRPQFLRGLDLGNGASLSIRDNQFDLLLTDLWEDFSSRYRLALEAMVKLQRRGVLQYIPRAERSERNTVEAMRNRLYRTCQPVEYEHDLLFAGDLGRTIFKDLSESEGVMVTGDTTCYLQGYTRYKGIQSACKVYDIGSREGSDPGEYFKLETTLLKAYFKGKGIGIRNLTEQPESQETVKDRLVWSVSKVVARLRGSTVEQLQHELGLSGGRKDRVHTDIARAMLDRPRTLTERVSALEAGQRSLERRVEQLEREKPYHRD